METKKGFLHISETIIMIMLLFVMIFQVASIPHMRADWNRAKILLMSHDLLYSLEATGLNWYKPDDVNSMMRESLPDNIGYSVHTSQDINPNIQVGIISSGITNFTMLKDEILTDFVVNGVRRTFDLEHIMPGNMKFPATKDVIIFWGFPNGITDGTLDDINIRNYLRAGGSVVEVSNLDKTRVNQLWHKDVFNLNWSESTFVPSNKIYLNDISPEEKGYKIQKLFYNLPYELISDSKTLGYWRMNHGSGLIAYDTSLMKNNNGILVDANHDNGDGDSPPDWDHDIGVYGDSLSFDGKDDYIRVDTAANSMNVGDGSFSIEAWINMKAANRGTIMSRWDQSTNKGWKIEINTNKEGTFNILLSDGTQSVNFQNKTDVKVGNKWYFATIVVNKDDTNVTLFINGEYIGEKDITDIGNLDANKNMRIGGPPEGNTDYFFNGNIDEVIFFDKALTQREIKAHYCRKFERDWVFTNYEDQTVYPSDGDDDKIILENKDRYTGGMHAGERVPYAAINWGIEGKGRSVWLSPSELDSANRHLLKSLVIWAGSGRDYEVLDEGELKGGVKASLYKTLDTEMFEPVRIDLTLGYYY